MKYVRFAGLIAVMLVLVGLTLSSLANAAEPVKTRERVYGLDLWDGKTYQGTFCPNDIKEIYMMANRDSLVMPLVTDVYYWPITQEYMGSWFDYRKELKGQLEIWQGSKKAATYDLTKYVFVYPDGPYGDRMDLVSGPDADIKYKEYKAMVDKYQNEVFEYYKQQSQYEEQLTQFIKNPKKFASPPKAPKEPVPPKHYVTEPALAFIVNLPPGVYEMQFIEHVASGDSSADGKAGGTSGEAATAPGSKDTGKSDKKEEPEPKGTLAKKLVVFEPRRHGVGYEIIPEEKWTMPSSTDEPREALYMEGKRVLFLKAFDEAEYNAKYYTKLSKLSQPFAGRGRENEFMWVHHVDRTDLKLQVLENGKVAQEITRTPYRVEQTPGYALGYKIVKYDPQKDKDQQPSFEAFRVEIEARAGTQIRLVDADGRVIPESVRTVKVVSGGSRTLIYLTALIPLVAGVAVNIFRRSIRHSAEGETKRQTRVM